MKNYRKTWCVAAALAAAMLSTQFSVSAADAQRKPALAAGNPNAGVPPNCLSADQVGSSNPQVHPPCSKPYGMTYGEWSAKWWQWVFSMPPQTNLQLSGVAQYPQPVTVDCSQNQSGQVWFLAANFGGFATRNCDEKHPIPPGVSIFFPVQNTYYGVGGFDCVHQGYFPPNSWPFRYSHLNECVANQWLYPDEGAGNAVLKNWRDLELLVAGWEDNPGPIAADVDGKAIDDLMAYRAIAADLSCPLCLGKQGVAPAYPLTVPKCNIMGYPADDLVSFPCGTGVADTYYPNGSDGYWLMLTPLPPGKHTVHFSAGSPPFLEVTYRFTVGH